MLYISTKFCEIILNSIKVIERTQFLYWKLQRGIILHKMKVEWPLSISAHRLVRPYISTKFCEIISNDIKVIERTRFLYWKLQRGIILHVTVFNLCTSSGHALHLCQVSWNYLSRYQSYGADTNDELLTEGRTDGRTDTQNVGGYNIIPRHFFVAGHNNVINTFILLLSIRLEYVENCWNVQNDLTMVQNCAEWVSIVQNDLMSSKLIYPIYPNKCRCSNNRPLPFFQK